MAAPLRMTSTEWALLGFLSILWGGSFFFVEVALQAFPPLTLVSLRLCLAAAVLFVIVRIAGHQMPATWAAWRPFFLLGLVNNMLPFLFLTWGQSQISGGLASILNATTPFTTILAAHFLTADDRMTTGRIFGIIIGFSGVVVMIGPAAIGGNEASFWGQLSCLGAPVCYAFGTIYARRFLHRGNAPMVTATGQFTTAAIMLLPITLIIDQPWTQALPDADAVAAIAGLVVFSTVTAYLIYFRILNTAGATNIQLVTFLVPATAIALGIVFLGETLATKHMIGMALIGLGLAAIDGRAFGWIRRG